MSSIDDEPGPAGPLLGTLAEAVARLGTLDLGALDARQSLALVREVEVVRRRLDAATDRLAGHLDETGAHHEDGHRTARAALVHLGRLPSPEAFGRVRTARALRRLPAVAAAYERGEIPTASVRAIAATAANPRVRDLLDEVVDRIVAEQAAREPHRAFVAWLREWERLADADGAEQDADRGHRRRDARLVAHPDSGWELRGRFGALQGAAVAEVLHAFEAAEWEADRADALAEHGPGASVEQFARTPAQRRADALVAALRRAAARPADARPPEPLVNVIVDLATLEEEVARLRGDLTVAEAPNGPDGRICRTTSGHPLHPSDVLAALVVGQVRRVVVDADSTVIDLGRRRRCFTGSAREAALLGGALRDRGGTTCVWSGCDSPRHQIDHHDPWHRGGTTDPGNATVACGWHNRLKEHGFRPVRRPGGGYDLVRPDGSRITPAA